LEVLIKRSRNLHVYDMFIGTDTFKVWTVDMCSTVLTHDILSHLFQRKIGLSVSKSVAPLRDTGSNLRSISLQRCRL